MQKESASAFLLRSPAILIGGPIFFFFGLLCIVVIGRNLQGEDPPPDVALAEEQTLKERLIASWQRDGSRVVIHDFHEKRTGRLGVEHRYLKASLPDAKSIEAFKKFAQSVYQAMRADIIAENPGASHKRIGICLYAFPDDFKRARYVLYAESAFGAEPVLGDWSTARVDTQPENLQPFVALNLDE